MAGVGEHRRVRLSLGRLIGSWYWPGGATPTALEIALVAVLYAWWSVMLERALAGRISVLPLLPLTVGWSFVANGILPVVECAPPCADAPRERDVAVVRNVILGAMASALNVGALVSARDRTASALPAAGSTLLAAVGIVWGLTQ
jgi:hypothetical protein